MVAVEDCETPMKMAMSIAKDATPDSTGKEILQRYRELVAQKSSERMKSLSLTNDGNQSLLSSPSSCESSLGSMTSIGEGSEDDYDHYSGDERDVTVDKMNRKEGQHLSLRYKADLTNAMAQEASMISNFVKGTIREKQSKTPLKTPAKKKTSTFNVFQDVTGGSGADDDIHRRRGGSCVKPRSNKKSVLQPKSTNTQRPSTDTKLMMKKKGLAGTSGGGTLRKVASKVQKSLIREEGEEESTDCNSRTQDKTKLSTPSNPQPSQKKRVNDSPKERESSPRAGTGTNVNSNVNNTAKVEEKCKSQKVLEGVNESALPSGSDQKQRQSSPLKNNDDKVSNERSSLKGRNNHGSVEREDGELLSFGTAGSSSVMCEVNSTELHEGNLLNDFESSMIRMKQSTGVVERGNDNEDEKTTTNSVGTPVNSVQTFSINGRSYSMDLSPNLLKNMFASPPGAFCERLENNKSTDNVSNADVESLDDRTMYNDVSMRSEHCLNDSVSPTSQIIATGTPQTMIMNGGISKSTAASLIERNKTLIKEVRFADQTCVELSERNASMQRDMKRMEGQLSEMKKDNEGLQNTIISTREHCAIAEENCKGIKNMLAEQKVFFEARMRALEQTLKETKEQNQTLNRQLTENNEAKVSTEKNLVSLQAKYEALQETSVEAKEKVSTLLERLAATQSTAEVSAASAAESYREYCKKMENRIDHLTALSDERLGMLNKERDERKSVEMEKDALITRCAELENIIENKGNYHDCQQRTAHSDLDGSKTPGKIATDSNSPRTEQSTRTPTSSVLARTLEAELRRGHDATERIMEAEMIISVTQSELHESTRQLELARTEIKRLNKKFEHLSKEKGLCRHSDCKESEPSIELDALNSTSDGDSSYDTCSTNELVGMALGRKLTHARNECEDYKRELESILNHIKRLQGESFNTTSTSQDGSNEQTIPGLLQAVRELAQVCAKQADEINELKSKVEEKKNRNKELEQIIAEKKEKITKQNDLAKELRTKIDNVSQLYSGQIEELRSTKSQMAHASKQFQKQLNQKKLEIANGEAKCSELVQKVTELSELCNRQSEEISLMQADMDNVNQNLQDKEQELFSHNHRQECLMNEVEDVVQRISHIREQYKFQK